MKDWEQQKMQEYEQFKQETGIQKLKRKLGSNPLVPVFFLGTVYAMFYMTNANRKGDKLGFQRGQRMRILGSALTITAITAGYVRDNWERIKEDWESAKINK